MPATAGGLIGKLYVHSPHARVDQMQATHGAKYNLAAYKQCMNAAALLFLLGFVSMFSCWNFLSWVGLPHLLAILYPYFHHILFPPFYFIYTCVVAIFVFINLIGGLSRGCLIFPILIELPMLVVSAYLVYLLGQVDATIVQTLKSIRAGNPQPAQPAMTTHAVVDVSAAAPQAVVQGVPVHQPQAANKV